MMLLFPMTQFCTLTQLMHDHDAAIWPDTQLKKVEVLVLEGSVDACVLVNAESSGVCASTSDSLPANKDKGNFAVCGNVLSESYM